MTSRPSSAARCRHPLNLRHYDDFSDRWVCECGAYQEHVLEWSDWRSPTQLSGGGEAARLPRQRTGRRGKK